MSAKHTGTPDPLNHRATAQPKRREGELTKSDVARFRAMTDDEIRRQIAEDPDLAPELDAAWFATATLRPPRSK